MLQPPRPITDTFFNWRELTVSVIQGLVITAATIITYQYAVQEGNSEALTRTMVFTTLIVANIFLTLVNRSFYFSIFKTLRYKNNLLILIIAITIGIMLLLLLVPPLTAFFGFESLQWAELGFCIAAGFVSVIWFEGYKFFKRLRQK